MLIDPQDNFGAQNLEFLSQSQFTFKSIVVICIRLAYSICCSFTNIMPRQDPVGYICRPSDSGSGDKDGPDFIRCFDVRQPKIHEVWTFGEDGITPEVYSTTHV